ncbi:hypothetical protein ACIRPH_13295 [Nocardiopsis sp. NPDC101807]|uniref:hypothetical protein n=1 Tax=Nocardiopsis sp. NPDC101807 TaxID=3364339 RepID=UPI0038162C9B
MPPAPDLPTSTTPLTTDEQVSMLTDGDDKISPATFPVPTASPGYIETLAAALRTAGQSVADTGNDIDSSWGALTSSYKAPEADELYTVLGPVARDGDDVLTGLDNAANALENFAEDLRGIKRRWNSLRTEAYTFRARIDAKDDDWRDAEGVAGFFGIGESPDVEENSRLISEGTGIIEDYEAAERDCANQINRYVPDRTGFEAMPSGGGELDPDVFYHGYEDSLSDLATEWDMGGATTDEHWWVDAGAAVWDFGVGAVEGTGAMLGMHSSEGWFQASWGDALWEYHEGNVQSVASLVGMYDGESDSWGWAGGDALGSAWKDLAHSVVPWEEWGERPGYVIGTAALNIVAMVGGAALTATGVGSVVGVPLMAWRGMAIVDGMGGRGGGSDSGSGTDVDVDLPAGVPNYGGVNSPIASLDASSFDRGDYSPAQWTELQTHLDRWASASDSGGGSSDPGGRPGAPGRPAQPRNDRDGQDPARPVDPTAQQLADSEAFWDIVDRPDLAEVDRAADQGNQQRIEEVARESQTDPNGPRGSEEGRWTAAELFDGPEGAGDRVPAGVGGRGDDTLTAERDAPVPTPDRTVNLTDGTGRGSDGDRVGERDPRTDTDARNRHGSDMRDRNPDVRNSADGGDPPKRTPSGEGQDGEQGTQRGTVGDHPSEDRGNSTGRPRQPTVEPVGFDTSGPSERSDLASEDHGRSPEGPDPATKEPAILRDKWLDPVEFGYTDASGRWFDEDGNAYAESPGEIWPAQAYERIRNTTGDIEAISETTGIKEEAIRRIKDHIFFRVHDVTVGPNDVRRGRFTPAEYLAKWWEKAPHGEIPESEKAAFRRWLEHESVESILMDWGMPYRSPDPSAWERDEILEEIAPNPTATHYGAHDVAPAENMKTPYGQYLEDWSKPNIEPNADLSNAEEIARHIFERYQAE